jgi:hypothetical protein
LTVFPGLPLAVPTDKEAVWAMASAEVSISKTAIPAREAAYRTRVRDPISEQDEVRERAIIE